MLCCAVLWRVWCGAGDVFLRHPYKRSIALKNEHATLQGKFEFLPQDEASKNIALLVPDKPVDSIKARAAYDLRFSLTPVRLGVINLPIYVKYAPLLLQPLL